MDHRSRHGATNDLGGEQVSFDPYTAAAVLRKLSDLATREPATRLMAPGEPLFAAAVAALSDAKEWLEGYRTPFDYFAGDLLLIASRDRLLRVSADTFASTLASAALEVVTVGRLVELRDVRAPSPDAASRRRKSATLGADGRGEQQAAYVSRYLDKLVRENR
jgi:hypothetical protein